jgi:hypothetical protein
MEKTYAEKELVPLGYKLLIRNEDSQIVLAIGHTKVRFDCACPMHPQIRALGCPLHHDGPGDSFAVDDARRIARIFNNRRTLNGERSRG